MAVPVVAGTPITSDSGASNVTSLVVNTPAGLADGDLLVTAVFFQNSNGNLITAPSGWTQMGGPVSALRPSGLYARPVPTAAGTPSTFTWSTSAAAGRAIAVCFRVTGADLADYLDVAGSESATTGTSSAVIPGVTTTGADRLLLGYNYTNTTGTTVPTLTPSGGWSLVATDSATASSNSTLWVGKESRPTAGATGNKTLGISPSTANSGGYLVTIKPLASTPATVNAVTATTAGAAPVSAVTAGAALVGTKATGTASGAAPVLSAGSSLALPKATGTALAVPPAVSAGTSTTAVKATGTAQALAPAVSAAAGAAVQAVRAVASGVSLPPGVAVPALVTAPKAPSTGSATSPAVRAGLLLGASVAVGGTTALAPVLSASALVPVTPAGSGGAALAPLVGAGYTLDASTAGATALALAPAVLVGYEAVLEVNFRPRSVQVETRLLGRVVRLKKSVRVVRFRVL